MTLEATHRYDDIIAMPHHQSRTHARMALRNRAAQFMPFAALTGYDAIIMEAARETHQRLILDEDAQRELDAKLQRALEQRGSRHRLAITYFRKDNSKDGGDYITAEGVIHLLDRERKALILEDHTVIPLEEIIALDDLDKLGDGEDADIGSERAMWCSQARDGADISWSYA
ncbi:MULTISPECIES: hypothetical protein [Bifidobacterium]|jgi:3-dehydroquinate synthase class II|uniref:hypothetical protein n=1 Tax=Bifidobacterium TaxID=1678 RepID=UPI002352514C|nr:hypothetical protein [Bifidobacterium tibiigranuli]MCI1211245.1 hypothetical protein [Bifidobacterium tibiigranuli]MCI1221342.1 hypothetical protein [Bifidobacterium tibiigranuli]MCI1232360.1 hypothetical protein [Bifidobacterium tibiigranuli]